MEWTSVPFKLGGIRNIIAIAVPTIVWLIIYLFWGIGWLILSIVLVGGSILPYFLPTTYILTEKDIIVKTIFSHQKKRWIDFGSFYVDKNGVLLSPFNKPSRLENYRGLYVRFHKNNREVVEFIEKVMKGKNGKNNLK